MSGLVGTKGSRHTQCPVPSEINSYSSSNNIVAVIALMVKAVIITIVVGYTDLGLED